MLYVEGFLTLTISLLLMISGPIDISKKYMLYENKHIYAIMLCFIVGIKRCLEGLIFDDYVKELASIEFLY